MAAKWSDTVGQRETLADGTIIITPGAVDHRRGNVARDVARMVDERAAAKRDEHTSKLIRPLKGALLSLTGPVCHWCRETFAERELEVDRLAPARDRAHGCPRIGQCANRCRCGYTAGAVVLSCQPCHRPQDGDGVPPRYALPADVVRARVASAPTADAVILARKAWLKAQRDAR